MKDMSSCSLLTSKLNSLKQSLRELELIMEDVATGKMTGDLKNIHKNWIEQFKQVEQQKREINETVFTSQLETIREFIFKKDFESLEQKLADLISKTDESFFKSILVELTKGLESYQLQIIKPIYLELLPKYLISITEEQALTGKYFLHDGNLILADQQSFKNKITFPDIIFGNIDLHSLTSAKDLILPQTIYGNLYLSHITSAKDLILPQTIGGDLDLYSLASAKDLVLPQVIGGSLNLPALTSDEGLILPKIIGGHLDLNSLALVKDLVLPETICGDLFLYSLGSFEGLMFPKEVYGSIYFKNLPKKDYDKLVRSRSDLKFSYV